jgi:hypothetical protein
MSTRGFVLADEDTLRDAAARISAVIRDSGSTIRDSGSTIRDSGSAIRD